MVMEYIELGPVPAGEPCAQIGTDGYLANSLRECEVYRRMLARAFPIPEGLPIKYMVRSHPHDFGPYREVSIGFAGGHQAAVDFACQVESALPDAWDATALHELAWFQRRDGCFKALRDGALPSADVLATRHQALLVAYPL